MNAQQLRNSILQQAIQGKLVPQDPADEPASVLLHRIRKEKERLFKKGVLKRKELFDRDIKEDEVPFEIPRGWVWTKIDNVAFVTKLAGFEYTKYIADNLVTKDQGVPLFKGKNVQNGEIIYEFEAFIPLSISNELKRSQISKKCLLTPYVGTIGNIGIHNKNGIFHLGSNVGKIEFYNDNSINIIEEYVKYYLMSSFGYEELTKYKKATAQESISIEAIRDVFLPLPPLAEQRRIVAKIEELMPLVERYGKAQQALDQLNESLPARLRQSILQEAIFGNHVGIQLSEIKDVKLKDVCEIVMGQSPEGNTYNDSNGIEFHQGKVAFGEMFLRPSGVFTTSPTKYAEPDSIVVSVRAPVGTANITKRKICIGRGLACIKPKQDADLMYIFYLLESPEVREYLEDNSTGTTFKAISGKVLQELEVPLPPLSEQKRIVAKVEELFGMIK